MPVVQIQLELEGDEIVARKVNALGGTFNQFGKTAASGSMTATKSVIAWNDATTISQDKIKQVTKGVEGLRREHERQRDALQLITRLTGLEVPRAAERAILSHKGLASAAAAAFNVGLVATFAGGIASLVVPAIISATTELGGFTKELQELDRINRERNRKAFVTPTDPVEGRGSLIEVNSRLDALEKEKRQLESQLNLYRTMPQAQAQILAYEMKLSEVNAEITKQTKLQNDLLDNQAELVKKLVKVGPDESEFTRQREAARDAATSAVRDMRAQISEIGKAGFALLAQQETNEIKKLRASDVAAFGFAAEQERLIHEKYSKLRVELERQTQNELQQLELKATEMRGSVTMRSIQDIARMDLEAIIKSNKKKFDYQDALKQAEDEYQIARLQMNGDTLGAMMMQEKAHVNEQLQNLRMLGVGNTELENLRVRLQATSNLRMAQEFRNAVEDMASQLESFADDIGSGNIGRRMLQNMKRMMSLMVAQWLLATNAMRGAFGEVFANVLFGPGSSAAQYFGGGASAIGAISGVASTPSFAGGTSTVSGISSMLGVSAGGSAIGHNAAIDAALGSFNPSSNLPINSTSAQNLASLAALQTVLDASGNVAPITKLTKAKTGISGIGANLIAMLPLAGGMVGQKFGGVPGLIGASLAGLIGAAALGHGPLAGTMMPGSLLGTLAAPVAGGLVGFGVGMQHGKLAGSISGAATGALIGMLVGGPILGGIIGLLGGLFGGIFGGGKRRRQAEQFARDQQGEITKIVSAYEGFQLDYVSALAQLEDMRRNSEDQLTKLKGEGKDVFRKKLSPSIDRAIDEIKVDQRERERRSTLLFGPPQFASGGMIEGPRIAGWRLADGAVAMIGHEGEGVINRRGMQRLGRDNLNRLNSGESISTTREAMVNVHLNVNAIDARSFESWLRNGKGGELITRELFRQMREGMLKL